MKVGDQEFDVSATPYQDGWRAVAFLSGGGQRASATWDTKEAAEMDLYKQLKAEFAPAPKFDPNKRYEAKAVAEELVRALLERDDIAQLPLPPEAKRYARMKSSILFKKGGQAKPQLYIKQVAATTNQQDKARGFKNYDGSAYSPKAREKQPKLEGGTADFLRKHGIGRTRQIKVERDPNHESYLAIPVYDRNGGWTNLFKVEQEGNPKAKLKDRLAWLARHRRGYRPGDIFVTELGRFMVTDVMGIREI